MGDANQRRALGRSKEIRNPGNLRCKLLLSRFSLMNYTNVTKYEAPEKNAACAENAAARQCQVQP